MGFRPDVVAGAGHRGSGVVDYRLARRSVLADYRKGRVSQAEVCDAHPELRRAAQLHSRPTSEACPICEDACLVLVSYVFGPSLPPYGRCVATLEELAKLARASRRHERPYTCYVVEVCPACHWNHLTRVFPLVHSAS